MANGFRAPSIVGGNNPVVQMQPSQFAQNYLRGKEIKNTEKLTELAQRDQTFNHMKNFMTSSRNKETGKVEYEWKTNPDTGEKYTFEDVQNYGMSEAPSVWDVLGKTGEGLLSLTKKDGIKDALKSKSNQTYSDSDSSLSVNTGDDLSGTPPNPPFNINTGANQSDTLPNFSVDHSGTNSDIFGYNQFMPKQDLYNKGSYVPGNRTGDKNPAMLEDGEYVLNRNAVKGLGKSFLDHVNNEKYPRFQSGGFQAPDENNENPEIAKPTVLKRDSKFKLKLSKDMLGMQGGGHIRGYQGGASVQPNYDPVYEQSVKADDAQSTYGRMNVETSKAKAEIEDANRLIEKQQKEGEKSFGGKFLTAASYLPGINNNLTGLMRYFDMVPEDTEGLHDIYAADARRKQKHVSESVQTRLRDSHLSSMKDRPYLFSNPSVPEMYDDQTAIPDLNPMEILSNKALQEYYQKLMSESTQQGNQSLMLYGKQ